MSRPPLRTPPPNVRQRRRADRSWRVWWEPPAAVRPLGFRAEDIDATTRGVRRAEELNAMAAAAARDGAPPRTARVDGARTVAALIRSYRADDHWTELRPATREDYAKAFAAIERDFGDKPVVALDKAAVRAWRSEVLRGARPWQTRGGGAFAAKAMVRKLSLLLSHAEELGWIPEDANPCLRLDGKRRRALKTPPRSRVASWEELGALLRTALRRGEPVMATAIALAALTAQRQADILKATPDEFARPGWWELTRSKKQNWGRIALHPVADGLLRQWAAQRGDGPGPMLLGPEGAPWRGDTFRKRFAAVRAEAAKQQPGVADLQFRDLRRTFGHLARLGGADKDGVGQVLGNAAATDPRLEATYMPAHDAIAARVVAAISAPADLLTEKECDDA